MKKHNGCRGILLIIAIFVLSIFKAILITKEVYSVNLNLSTLQYFGSDLQIISSIFLLIILSGLVKSRIVSFIIYSLINFLCLWYVIETYCLLILDIRLNIGDIYLAFSNLSLVSSMFSWKISVPLVLFYIYSFRIKYFSQKQIKILLCSGLLINFISFFVRISTNINIAQYVTSAEGIIDSISTTLLSDTYYSSEEIEKYKKYSVSSKITNWPESKPTLIIVVVESLGAENLSILGGKKLLPNFENIIQDGRLYTNFYSNYRFTSGAMVSIFQGLPIIPFPGSDFNIYKAYRKQDSLVKDLVKLGYDSKIVFGVDYSQFEIGNWAKSIGFKDIYSADNQPEFINKQRFSGDAVEDQLVFDKALELYKVRKDPTLLTILTTSSHEPLNDPKTGSSSEVLVWKYVDEQITNFYKNLVSLNFFDKNYLIVLGDHPKFKFNFKDHDKANLDLSPWKVPLVVFGPNIIRGEDPREFSQSDLLSKLPNIFNHNSGFLSEGIFLLDHWTMGSNTNSTNLIYKDKDAISSYLIDKKNIIQTGELNIHHKDLPDKIHSHRAIMQSKNIF